MEESREWFFTPCGLDCSSCSIHLRTPEELNYWRKQKVDLDKIRCDGCRSDRKYNHWSPDCKILNCCVYERGLEFCFQCEDFPCKKIEEWGKEFKHHERAVKRLHEMKRIGLKKWILKNFD